jgi:dihydrodipicolinate synthase/N-acetylneuraminate lyase
MARLAEIDNIVGVKEAGGSIDQVLNIIEACGDKLDVSRVKIPLHFR